MYVCMVSPAVHLKLSSSQVQVKRRKNHMEKNKLSTSNPAQLSRSGLQPVWVLNSHHKAPPPAALQSSPNPPYHFFHRLACQLPTCLERVQSAERGIGLVSWGCLKCRCLKLGNWLNSKMLCLTWIHCKGLLGDVGQVQRFCSSTDLGSNFGSIKLCHYGQGKHLSLWPRAPSRPFHQAETAGRVCIAPGRVNCWLEILALGVIVSGESLSGIIMTTARESTKQARSAEKRAEVLSLIGNLQPGAGGAFVQQLRE